jgi:hypothetical protein
MAGDSNILYWLQSRGIEATDVLVDAIRSKAKSTNRVLEEFEVMEVVNEARA